MANRWGPFHDLTNHLASAAPGGGSLPGKWIRVLTMYGSPWDIYAKNSLSSQLKGRFRAPDRVEKINDSLLAALLLKCHAWLGIRSSEYLTRKLSPFYSELPGELFRVSSGALMWSLYTFAVDTYGAHSVLQFSPPALGEPVKFGDALCLHLNIESLLERLPKKLHLAPVPTQHHRYPGGLRTQSFLTVYPALMSSRLPKRLDVWRESINRLIGNSPLTQLIYPDMVGRIENFIPIDMSSKEEQEIKWWRDFWYSQLARSIIGAMRSEPLVFEELRRAEKKLNDLVNRVSMIKAENKPAVNEAQIHCQQLRRQRAMEYAVRLGNVGAMLAKVPFLHLRVVDMLLRYNALICAPGMIHEWKEKATGSLPSSRILFNRRSVYFETFERILFGQPYKAFSNQLQADEAVAYRQTARLGLETFLDLPRELEPERLASQSGVPTEWARRLIALLKDVGMKYPDLPPPPPQPPGSFSPAAWLAEMAVGLLTETPAESIEVLSEDEIEEVYYA